MTSNFTASGARRTGDEYQDLQSAEVLIEWLEDPDLYRWVHLETMEGSLDDIQAEFADGSRRLLQVKFGTHPTVAWEWDELLRRQSGQTGPKPSLLQKWKASIDDVQASGVAVREAAFITNRALSADIRAHLQATRVVDFASLPAPLRRTIAEQLGGYDAAAAFFASFHFFRDRALDVLEATLWERFRRLGGTSEGWASLLNKIRRWINRQNEPTPGGIITLADVREAALWHLPPPIPQDFVVPPDYIPPEAWSSAQVRPSLQAGGDRVVVVTGSPGIGKSTYLSWLVNHLRRAEIPVVRHHYFLSTSDATPNRSDWETAATAIIGQLLASYPDLVRAADNQNPLPNTLTEFLAAAGQERAGMDPIVVIVDGLDHVWRDTGSEEELRRLFDHLLPPPEGVVVLVGTQDIDMARVPAKLRDHCPHERWLEVPTLDRDDVYQWLRHHEADVGLFSDDDPAAPAFSELADAFHDVSGGHPLVLHYTLGAARQLQPPVFADQIRELPHFDPNSTIATYYHSLWHSIPPEGHQLLHLLAGFPWAWPRDGLVQCLAAPANLTELERAEQAIRHVLGVSRAGVTAFHESLLAFVRALPAHETAAWTLRPRVIEWLARHAPEYWRWRYEWEERARNGDANPLTSSVTLDWCVESLMAGRSRTEVAEVVAASGWAALSSGCLGMAMERHYLDAYLNGARHAEGVLAKLMWLGLRQHHPRDHDLELNLALARNSHATAEEIEAVAEVAFSWGHYDICDELFDECAERWDAAVGRADWTATNFEPLERTLPFLAAASLSNPPEGLFQRYVREHGSDPGWCPGERYAKALARLCVVGEDTHVIREELRFLANQPDRPSVEAVDEIVRLACREGFDPDGWIQDPEARRSGLFRCYQRWVRPDSTLPPRSPREVSFQHPALQDHFRRDESVFVELARSYFFSCLACAVEERQPAEPIGLEERAFEVASFLSGLHDLAVEAAAHKREGRPLGGGWFVTRLGTMKPPEVKSSDYHNDLVRRKSVARIVVAIAQDLEDLHLAETGVPSLTSATIAPAVEGDWTWEGIWIEDRVERRLPMRDPHAARVLVTREQDRLETSRDYLHTRAEEYASLAQFCVLHQELAERAPGLARLSARNLFGHGFHKDMVLYDLLDAIRVAPGQSTDRALERLRAVSPVVQIVDEITDGDETRHLKSELATVAGEAAPESLPSYIRVLQENQCHWEVESCFTDIAKTIPLQTRFERALASTLVHERALFALQQRTDPDAGTVLGSLLSYFGRQTVPSPELGSTSSATIGGSAPNTPPIEDYPPERLAEFVQAVREARIIGDERFAAWTSYWRDIDPDSLLVALTTYRDTHDRPLEKQTARMVVNLAFERSGRGGAWPWLIAYHQVVFGWSWVASSLDDVTWIWEAVRDRFGDRWLDFISATCRPRWGTAGGAPGWSVARMVQFLDMVGRPGQAQEVLDAAVRWGAGLAANMRLPDASLTAHPAEIPSALRLLVDRLDCPSRLVQERACWALAELLADSDHRTVVTLALLNWHRANLLEMRSCVFLTILHLAQVAHGLSDGDCMDIARQADLVPSVGTELLLREFGDAGAALASVIPYQTRHSGPPTQEFSGVDNFDRVVGAHLAPIFRRWAAEMDKLGIGFFRQWEWEARRLVQEQGLSLRLNAHFHYHYRRSTDDGTLSINDRLSMVLRSAYLRTLHRFVEGATLTVTAAEAHARRVAVLADPVVWAVRPVPRPGWWPADESSGNKLDTLGKVVGQAVRSRLKSQDPEQVLLYAAGPVRNEPEFIAEVVIRAFLQSAHGPLKPSTLALVEIPCIACEPTPPRLSLPGTYGRPEPNAGFVSDWLMAPLAWRLEPDTQQWLLLERQMRAIYVPATWVFAETPTIGTGSQEIQIRIADHVTARYRYWHDDIRERHIPYSGSKVGGELVIDRACLDPHLASGATLCWVVTLWIFQRERHDDRFGEPHAVGTWLIGGSHIMWPNQWRPPSPD